MGNLASVDGSALIEPSISPSLFFAPRLRPIKWLFSTVISFEGYVDKGVPWCVRMVQNVRVRYCWWIGEDCWICRLWFTYGRVLVVLSVVKGRWVSRLTRIAALIPFENIWIMWFVLSELSCIQTCVLYKERKAIRGKLNLM